MQHCKAPLAEIYLTSKDTVAYNALSKDSTGGSAGGTEPDMDMPTNGSRNAT